MRWLSSIAAPGATLTSEATVELLLEHLGDDITIVPLGTVTTRVPGGASVCGLALAGREHTARLDLDEHEGVTPDASAASITELTDGTSRHHLVVEALQHPATLVSLTIAGLALIYVLVLAAEMGGSGLGLAVLVLGVVATVVCFAWRYSVGYGEEEARRGNRAGRPRRDRSRAPAGS